MINKNKTMKFDITGRHLEITPALREHIEGQFSKIAPIFEGKPADAHVILEVERGRHRSEIVVHWRNEVLMAETSDSDMYLSLSQSIEKIEKQARKIMDKIVDKSHKVVRVSTVEAEKDVVR